MKAENGKLFAKPKTIALTCFSILFFTASILGMYLDKTTLSIVFAAGCLALLFLAYSGTVEYLKFGSALEMKMREVKETLEEAKELIKLVAEVSIPLAHYSEGWASSAPSTIKTKNLVLSRVEIMVNDFDIVIDEEVLEHNYYNTCADYVGQIIHAFPNIHFHSRIVKKFQTNVIPDSIADVQSPEALKKILTELDVLDRNILLYLEMYEFYYTNRKHKDKTLWLERNLWSIETPNQNQIE